ncbi:kinesin-like protein KIF9 [Prorops nasuta]|uniref:kinesin-like protein KIF9 n=1 Tax=Prorops nasuta TaxID=863751 RepID=UPI0034CFD22A
MIDHKKIKDNKSNIKFFVRILPLGKPLESYTKIDYETKTLYIKSLRDKVKNDCKSDKVPSYWSFQTDGIFHETPQESVYCHTTKDLLQKALSGVNCVVICYGQIGTGKSYTVGGFGQNWPNRGLVVRLIADLFAEKLDKCKTNAINCSLTFIEVHGKRVIDLFTSELNNITKINENDPYKDVNKFQLSNENDAIKKLFLGEVRRSFVEGSSYPIAHLGSAVITFHLTNKSLVPPYGDATIAKVTMNTDKRVNEYFKNNHNTYIHQNNSFIQLHIVEMAGTGIPGSNCFKQISDTGQANLTMTQLRQYFACLSKMKSAIKIAMSSNKLLKIIGNELQVTSLINLIAHIRVTEEDYTFVKSTLHFGTEVAKIQANQTIYNILPQDSQMIHKLQNEVHELKKELDLFYMLSDQESSNNISESRKHEITEDLLKFLNDNISDLTLCSVAQIQIYVRGFRKSFESGTWLNYFVIKILNIKIFRFKCNFSAKNLYTYNSKTHLTFCSFLLTNALWKGKVELARLLTGTNPIKRYKIIYNIEKKVYWNVSARWHAMSISKLGEPKSCSLHSIDYLIYMSVVRPSTVEQSC